MGILKLVKYSLTDPKEISMYNYHPHASKERLSSATNVLYLPTENLSFNASKKGYGIFNYSDKLVLTMKNKPTGTWNCKDVYMPSNICGGKKNSAKNGGLYYQGIWQELVLKESEEATDWAKSIILG